MQISKKNCKEKDSEILNYFMLNILLKKKHKQSSKTVKGYFSYNGTLKVTYLENDNFSSSKSQ